MGPKDFAVESIELKKRYESGHRTCPGCAIPLIVRTVLASINRPVVIVNATGCMEVTSTTYPFTSWNVPFIHTAFANASATASGIEKAITALKKKGIVTEDIAIVVFGGDGGTYDIGLQSLSGALERGHDFLYITYDNEAYSNTGNQRSAATEKGTKTTTTPVSKYSYGKLTFRKNLTKIIAAHNIPYVAQTSIAFLDDFSSKVKKAMTFKGPKFINVLSPCTRYWGIEEKQTIEIARLAVATNFWPLYEIYDGTKYIINTKPTKTPITEFLGKQSRFKHLFSDDFKGVIDDIQEKTDKEWEYLLKLEEISSDNKE